MGCVAAARRSTAYLVEVNVVVDTDEEPREPQILRSLVMLLAITLFMVGGIALGLALLF